MNFDEGVFNDVKNLFKRKEKDVTKNLPDVINHKSM